jgi:hypothetical protein
MHVGFARFNIFHAREYKAPERFPPPHVVAETPLSTLRTVGLSARKAEYSELFTIFSALAFLISVFQSRTWQSISQMEG